MQKVEFIIACMGFGLAGMVACSSGPAPETETPAQSAPVAAEPVPAQTASEPAQAAPATANALPASYKDIQYPDYKYVAPYPKDFRVELAPGIAGYIVVDRSLPLVNFTAYFENPRVPTDLKDEAANEIVGSMFRRGGGAEISAHALDDTLEFISAGLSTSVGTWVSSFSVNSLTKDFPTMLDLAQKVVLKPAFDKEQLEIVKTNFVTAY